MSDLERNRAWSGAPETDDLRPYSEMLPNWNELSDGTKAMLNDIDGIRPFAKEQDRLIEEYLEEYRAKELAKAKEQAKGR